MVALVKACKKTDYGGQNSHSQKVYSSNEELSKSRGKERVDGMNRNKIRRNCLYIFSIGAKKLTDMKRKDYLHIIERFFFGNVELSKSRGKESWNGLNRN